MEIVTIKDVEADKSSDVIMKTLFDENIIKDGRTKFGTVVIPPGVRVPQEGAGSHGADEYSIVLKGSIVTMSGGKEYRVTGGQATFIPAGEAHWCLNDGKEDCEIVWVLVNR
ncbi:Cupin 2 conserved barrel domain protein [Desulfotomaculum nigrificans CO-1-SRB]|uniref:Cupin 2 conserved barrel domain protein n=1 Tax=Desulfotomaculum nigrificans (strain DSM 14880 / VKM B-2319 / CO-1-SRB) TaxID=868595 RepID=F6B7R8_DESCC|nr:cupin domain-containing protein [Desulfotomaculum nigrificans]AEF93440.1 Cupin 2 conserved barrel domain protein [Desulfotomaculum nigrificans CO-1-SRB]